MFFTNKEEHLYIALIRIIPQNISIIYNYNTNIYHIVMNILQEHIQTLRTIWIALELPGQIAFSGIFALWLYGWMKLAIKYHHKKKQAKKEFQQCNYKQPQCTVRTCLNKDKPNEYAFGGGISSCPIRYTLTDAERKELKRHIDMLDK